MAVVLIYSCGDGARTQEMSYDDWHDQQLIPSQIDIFLRVGFMFQNYSNQIAEKLTVSGTKQSLVTEGRTTENDGSVVVFDIGGTWFRSAILLKTGGLGCIGRQPAINYINTPHRATSELQRALVRYLVDKTRELGAHCAQGAPVTASISLGAAMNAHNGFVFNSGPLWGPRCEPFDLLAELRASEPAVHWILINDVSAALLSHAAADREFTRRMALVTVSTGIACRIYDRQTGDIPVDSVYGLQGEIGHLPISFVFDGEALELTCDCGGKNHLNAFCSGRGIDALVLMLEQRHPEKFQRSALKHSMERSAELRPVEHLRKALDEGDPLAAALLEAITRPLASMLLTMLTVDPQIEKIHLTGGVARTLGLAYTDCLRRQMELIGLYQISSHDPHYFATLIQSDQHDDHAGLIGAGIVARQTAGHKPDAGRWTVTAQLPVRYEVVESEDVLNPANASLLWGSEPRATDIRRCIVVDEAVYQLYGARIQAYFAHHRVEYSILPLCVSEDRKQMDMVFEVFQHFDAFHLQRRKEPVIAIGGGVLLDIVGLAANLYRRGVPYIRVPTTLIGLVDAAVGIKTGVNVLDHKNRAGTYYAPLVALLDRSFLRTIDQRHFCNGLAEILKIAIIKDPALFERLEAFADIFVLPGFRYDAIPLDIVRAAVHGMLVELEPNLWEHVLERVVDFGHTFGPVLEMRSMPDLLHGETVAIDMAFSSVLAQQRGLITSHECQRIITLTQRLSLPITHPLFTQELLVKALHDTTRHRDGLQRVPLPTGIGSATFVNDLTPCELERALEALNAYTRSLSEYALGY
jgi:3-dehydroquinate synthetase/predicted NBD/HSP70 family sugar kinase